MALDTNQRKQLFEKTQRLIADAPRLSCPLREAASLFQNDVEPTEERIRAFDRNMLDCIRGDHSYFTSAYMDEKLRELFNDAHEALGDGTKISESGPLSDDYVKTGDQWMPTKKYMKSLGGR